MVRIGSRCGEGWRYPQIYCLSEGIEDLEPMWRKTGPSSTSLPCDSIRQKLGVDEGIFIVDLMKGAVYTCPSFLLGSPCLPLDFGFCC
jgi:hypothetical protein